jgi:hypothetical protein
MISLMLYLFRVTQIRQNPRMTKETASVRLAGCMLPGQFAIRRDKPKPMGLDPSATACVA